MVMYEKLRIEYTNQFLAGIAARVYLFLWDRYSKDESFLLRGNLFSVQVYTPECRFDLTFFDR